MRTLSFIAGQLPLAWPELLSDSRKQTYFVPGQIEFFMVEAFNGRP